MEAGQRVASDEKDEHGRNTPRMGQKSTKEIELNHPQAGYNSTQMKVTKSSL